MSADLVTESGKVIPALRLTPSLVMDRSLVINGPSRTGKTHIVKAIMDVLRSHVDQILVVAPTEASNQSYAGFVDPLLVHSRVWLADPANPKREDGVKGAVRFLDAIVHRQEMAAAIYSKASRPEILSELYRRLPREARVAGLQHIEAINAKRVRLVDHVARALAADPVKCEERTKALNARFREMLARIYKCFVGRHYEALWRADLSEDERYCLAYLNFSPRLLLIFDDCAAQLKQLFSREIWRKLFYQGRHSFITLILTCQDDSDLPPNLRKNGFLTFFTEPVVASSAFERPANKYPKPVKTLVAEVVSDVFRGKHRKLVFVRDDERGEHLYTYTAPNLAPFAFGSGAVAELCSAVRGEGTALPRDNPYFARFAI